ncbi:filaggrin-2-like [Argonauta hians]
MHGVMMHGDKARGKDHSHEHRGSQDKGPHDTKAGPQDIEQYMHGVMMHGDKEQGKDHNHEHAENIKDKNNKVLNFGPQNVFDYLHGVLMHGDSQPGREHHNKDNKKETINPKFRGKIRVEDYEDYLHGVLMHGDRKPGKIHRHVHSEEAKNTGKEIKKDKVVAAPMDYEEYLHGVLMHNDAKAGESHVHEHRDKFKKTHQNNEPSSPGDVAELMHGLTMHGEASIKHKHSEHENNKKTDNSRSQAGSVLAPDIEGLDESLHNKNPSSGRRFAKRKIKVKDSKKRDLEEDVKPVEENRISGYLYSIYKTIHDMKEKYFSPKTDKSKDGVKTSSKGNGKSKQTSEDVGIITNEEALRRAPVHDHAAGDMRSDLELIGNTAPFRVNYRTNRHARNKHDEG